MPVPNVQPKHLIFVYGTLKKTFGGRAHQRYLQDRPMKGVCAVPGVMVHLGGYPGLVEDDVCQSTGEVYEVDAVEIQAMDGYEGVPHNYCRKLVDTPWGRAWAYFKNHVPSPIPDQLVCVDRGVWQGGDNDRAPYRQVRDFYANKRWQQPEYRNMQVQPVVNAAPSTIPAAVKTQLNEAMEEADRLLAKARQQAVTTVLVKLPEVVQVGLGTEMM